MNKFIKNVIFLIFMSIFTINIIDAKSQNVSKIVKSQYDSKTKELYIWGANHVGNLGTGDYKDVLEEDKVKVNSKIGNQKIIEYAITDSQTYVLTEKNKVYASGFSVGDGNFRKSRNTFIELKFYNQSKYKIISLKITDNSNFQCEDDLKIDDKCTTEILFGTNNKKRFTKYYNYYYISTTPGIRDWFEDFIHYEYGYGNMNGKYPIYYDKTKNNEIVAVVNNKGKLGKKYIINHKNRKYKKYLYNNGQINYYRSFSDYKDIIKRYKDGKKSSGNIIYYKLRFDKSRLKTKEHKYTYNNGVLKTRYSYKRVNKKMIINVKKFYYPNKKNQFKSNKNGKAKCYVTYYKNKKAYVTYRYYYNSKGKMINKTKVKIKKSY